MNGEHEKAWSDLASRARQGERRMISSPDAERLLQELPDDGISEADMNAIVEAVLSERPLQEARVDKAVSAADDALQTPSQRDTAAPPASGFVEEGVLQLNRNKGAEDERAKSTLDELRREALEDHEQEDLGQ